MILSFNYQAVIFLTMIILGAGLGFCYDLLRIFRMIIRHRGIFLQLEDFLFWLGAAGLSFSVMLKNYSGEIRPFVLLGIALGMIGYFCAASPLVLNTAGRLIGVTKGILKIAFAPIVKFLRFMTKPAKNLINFFLVKCKKLLQVWKLYVKLNIKKLRYQLATIFKR